MKTPTQIATEAIHAFIADMGARPSLNHSIDRINNSIGYFPENCRWATMAQQSNNRRSSVWIEYDGHRMTVSQWARKLGFVDGVLRSRIKRGWGIEKALTTPSNR